MGRKIIGLFMAFVLISVFFTGCWDKVEIEQRGFVSVIAVDMAPPGYEEDAAESVKGVSGTQKPAGKMIKATYVFPNAIELAGEGGGGGGGKGFTGISSVAASLDKTSRYVDSRISRSLFFGFIQVIILGEEFLKNPDSVRSIVDSIIRDPEFNRTARVLVADGEASKIADIEPKGEKFIFRYIRGILDNEASNGRIVQVDLNDFISLGNKEGTGIVPKISIKDKEVKISGVGLIKNYRLVGYLPEYDTMFFNLLSGKRRGGTESIKLGDLQVDFALRDMERQIVLINDDPKNLEIGIKIEIEGTILGGKAGELIYDDEKIKMIEKELNAMEEESSRLVIAKLQKEFNIDALEIGSYVKKFHPLVWSRVKDRWEEVYPGIKITPVVENKVRRIGTSK